MEMETPFASFCFALNILGQLNAAGGSTG
jgi:hypothetical protein